MRYVMSNAPSLLPPLGEGKEEIKIKREKTEVKRPPQKIS